MTTQRNFKARASSAGKLMTSARKKDEVLSETTKTYLQEWLKSEIYGVKKEIYSKQIEKGIVLEDEAIDFVVANLDIPFTIKNEKSFEDDFFTGTPDIILDDTIIDIKVSWDCFTFPLFDTEIPTKDYFYQLQVYMHLTGKSYAKLVYVLLNTPENLMYEIADDYSGVDPKYRIKVFDIEYQPEIIEELKEKVILANEYINNLKQSI